MLDFDTVQLGSTYKRYKLGTTKIKNWLCETSIQIARRNGKALPATEDLSSIDLLRLAKTIIDAKPKVTVPLAILLCTKDVIDGRTLCASFYQQFELADNKTGEAFVRMNKSHQHFISVLKDIHALLKELKVEFTSTAPAHPSKPSAAIRKKPAFDVLELEEPSDSPDETPSVPQATSKNDNPIAASKSSASTPNFSFEEEVEMEESFAIFCAFQDIRAIRLHLQEVWKGYYNGEISFLVAMEITKAGFPMIDDIGYALSDACSWINLYDDIAYYLGLESSVGGGDSVFFFNKLAKVLPNAGLRDPHGNFVNPQELFCAPAYTVMHDFRLYSQAKRDPTNENLRIRTSTHPLAEMLRRIEPTVRLMADQVGFNDFGDCSVRGFLIDTVTESLIYANKYGGFTISAVANCQILMDVLDALGMKPQVGFDVLQDTLARESDSFRVEMYSNFAGRLKNAQLSTGWHATVQATVDALKIRSSNLKSEETANGQRGLPSGQPKEITGTYEWPADRHPEDLLTSLPFLSGLRLSLLAFNRCCHSSLQANKDVSLLSAAYAYRAAQAFGLIRRPWPDMDSVINSQSMHGSYVLEASSMEGYARRFDIAIGVSPSNFSSDSGRGVFRSRPTVPSAAKIAAKMKKLKPASSFMLSVDEASGRAGTCNRRQFYEALHLTAQRVYNTKRQNNLTPQELLNALQKSLLEEEVYLKFDYGCFSERCQALFIAARIFPSEQKSRLKKYQDFVSYGIGNAEDVIEEISSVEISELVHAALWEAAELEKNGSGWRIKTESKLGKIAGIIQRTIDADPDSWLSIARHGSSGYLPASEAPCRRWKWGGKAPVFGPITPQEHELRQVEEKCTCIQNEACGYFNKLQFINISHEARVARVKLFIDQKLLEAGIGGMEMGELKVVPEYRIVRITWKKKMHHA